MRDDEAGYAVQAEVFAKWAAEEETKRTGRSNVSGDSAVRAIAMLTQRAKRERLLGAPKSVHVDGESLEVLGNVLLRDIVKGKSSHSSSRLFNCDRRV